MKLLSLCMISLVLGLALPAEAQRARAPQRPDFSGVYSRRPRRAGPDARRSRDGIRAARVRRGHQNLRPLIIAEFTS